MSNLYVAAGAGSDSRSRHEPVTFRSISRYLRPMTRGHQLALLGAIALTVSSCGASAQVITQRQEIAYQTKIGLITNRLARSPADPRHIRPALQQAIKQYERIKPPLPVRRLHAQFLDGLRKELGALRSATSAGADTATIHAAVRADARARGEVNRTLKRMTTLIGACRTDAARC